MEREWKSQRKSWSSSSVSEKEKEYPVVIVEYNPQWPALFEDDRRGLILALDGMFLGIEHIGSTAVPGLAAKPIIDILVFVDRLDSAEEYIQRLAPLGYVHYPSEDERVRRLFFDDGCPCSRHLTIVEKDSFLHRRYTGFRDFLRSHPEDAREYEQLKRDLSERYKFDRLSYAAGKRWFVRFREVKYM